MFQFRQFPVYGYVFTIYCIGITLCGFPHSDICGLSNVCFYPQLFAAYHVLLRLPVPRHSPCALFNLTVFCFRFFSCQRLFEICSFPRFLFNVSFAVALFSFQGAFYLLDLYTLSVPSIPFIPFSFHQSSWWAQVDSNHRPHAYQACALTA